MIDSPKLDIHFLCSEQLLLAGSAFKFLQYFDFALVLCQFPFFMYMHIIFLVCQPFRNFVQSPLH